MAWKIELRENAVVIEMNSNKANLHNPAFFQDFHQAFDQIDEKHPLLPVIITAPGQIFSAGIDFSYSFQLFQRGDLKEIAEWFGQYSRMMMRLFQAPRLTVAAMNGHTFAGGMILALCCDFRIAAKGNFKFSINEVPVGVPMPSVYTEIIRFRLGDAAANETILSGDVYEGSKAIQLGLIKEIVEPSELLNAAIKQTQIITPACYLAYRHSKKMMQYPTLKFIEEQSSQLEIETVINICAPDSVKAQMAAAEKMKKK